MKRTEKRDEMRLVYLSSAWVLGIFLGSIASSLGIAPKAGGLLLITTLTFWLARRQGKIFAFMSLLLLVAGFLRFQQTIPVANEQALQFYNGQGEITVEGMIAEEPEIGDSATTLRLEAQQIKIGQETRKVAGGLLVRTQSFPFYSYGDHLRLKGRLEAPAQSQGIDYKGYLAQQGIYSLMVFPQIEIAGSEQGLRQWLFHIRLQLSQSLESSLPEPHSSLAQALILGIRSNIPDSLMADFRSSGTTHILAISGLQVTLLLGLVLSLGAWLWGRQRPFYILVALSAIWVYAFLAGMSPSVWRAAIMGSFVLAAQGIGRPYSSFASLAFAAALMTGLDPLVLWNISFQLSFLAMAGLILLAPPLQAWSRKGLLALAGGRKRLVLLVGLVLDSFAVSLGAVLATVPLIIYRFHLVSLVSLPATLLALPALPGIILSGLIVGILGVFLPPLAQVAGWGAWFFISSFIKVVESFAGLPFASFRVGVVDAWVIELYYGSLALAFWLTLSWRRWGAGLARFSQKATRMVRDKAIPSLFHLPRKATVGVLLLAIILVWAIVLTPPPRYFEVSFLDVGQGDAILIQTPYRQQILIDGGPSLEAISLQLGKQMPFWDRNLDLVVLTHPHQDHLTGLVEVLGRYKVGQVLEAPLDSESPVYQEWQKLMKEKKIPSHLAQQGQEIRLGEKAILQVMNPPAILLQGTDSDTDNNGIVLRLVIGEVSFLLTADIQEETENELIYDEEELSSTVLKVAHHGSETSTSATFLAVVSPQAAVISVAKDNLFGHPDSKTLSNLKEAVGERIYLTSQQGTITFVTDGKKLWIETEE